MKSLAQCNKYKNYITEYFQVLSQDNKFIYVISNKNLLEVLYEIEVKDNYEKASLEAETLIHELKTLKRF